MNKFNKKFMLISFVIMAVLGIIFMIIGAIGYKAGPAYGAAFIAGGAVFIAPTIVMSVWAIISYYLNNKKKIAFNEWLNQQGLKTPKIVGGIAKLGDKNKFGFVIDMAQRKWCKFLVPLILDCSEIIGVDVKKNGASMTQSSSATIGKATAHSGIFAPHANFSSISGSTSETKDTSTYDVYIQTSNLETPMVMIPCEQSYHNAQNICSIIRLLLDKTDDASQQKPKDKKETNEIQTNLSDEIQRYKKLVEDGVITQEDFEQKKKQILGL